ncbi:MAG: DUF2721 domain-containing protein [Planctomycetota bacterium]
MTTLSVFELLVAPVVMISAGGLICLALYNRLAMVVSRARQFHKERFDAVGALRGAAGGGDDAERLRARIEVLDRQSAEVRGRAVLIRNALIALMLMMVCMLLASLALGLTPWLAAMGVVAEGLFVAGVVSMLVSIGLAIGELRRSLDPVNLEAAAVTGEAADRPE